MPFRFKYSEDIRTGFRRIAQEQVDLALRELSGPDLQMHSVHAGRKAMKRLRALIRSAAPALGNKQAGRLDRAVRDVARLLSSRRDRDVVLTAIAALESHYGNEALTALAPLRQALEDKAAAPGTGSAGENLVALRQQLTEAGVRLQTAEFSDRGIEIVIAGIEDSYRIGCRALKRAYRQPDDENFHALRKAVQTHWRHMSLLSRAWPDAFAVRITEARALSEILGDDHDLALVKHAAQELAGKDRTNLRKLCKRRQTELRAAAHARAGRLYAEHPEAFAARMTAYWKTGRKVRKQPAHDDAGAAPKAAVEFGSPAHVAAKTRPLSPSHRRS